MDSPFVHPALLQEPVGGKLRCLTCERGCELAEGQTGWCRTRQNRAGQLYTLTYGAVSSLSCNPIEKKPLYHFCPGSLALTVGSWSCNFACPWCQNWHISKSPPAGGEFIGPAAFVARAQQLGCQGTSISLNEPTLSLEWALEVLDRARSAGLYNTLVTNGYMTAAALEQLIEAGLDAMNVDIKGDGPAVQHYCQADVEKVWRNCRLARQAGVWLELTTLMIPGVNDDTAILQGIAARIASGLGPEVPWHLTAYYPAYRFSAPPTPASTLERAWQIGHEAGLAFVYLGNVPGHRLGNTTCPACGRLLIGRQGLAVTANYLPAGRCPGCGRVIAGVWTR